MSTYAEVELKVTIKLTQPWNDDESAEVVRKRAKVQAAGILSRALVKGDVKNIMIDNQAMIKIYSEERR